MRGLASHQLLALIMVSFAVILLFLTCNVIPVHAPEPSLMDIFNYFHFTNVTETTVETFPAGKYNITLYAEFAAYYNENELSCYEVNTSNFTEIFTGPEGGYGYISPVTKSFTTDYQFGLSLLSHGYRCFTETFKNPYQDQHAKVYRNLDDPNMFLIGFDESYDCNGRGDGDFNDMVFSLQLQYYLTVISPYDTPSGEGWYHAGANAFASLAHGVVNHGNGTRRVFSHWSGDSSGTDYSKSEPIYMNQNKTAIANWKTQYEITFDQTGVGVDCLETVLTVDGNNYGVTNLPVSFWWDKGSTHDFTFQSPLIVTHDAKRYFWKSTTGLSKLQSNSITASTSGSVTGNYKTQFYLTVTSPYDLPTPTSDWFDAGTPIDASVTSPWLGPTGVRYICTGWTGTGSVPIFGTVTSVSFVINEPSSITWEWETQYYLTVQSDPLEITAISGEGWYNYCKTVELTAPPVEGYDFLNWDVDGNHFSENPIQVHMDEPHTATAHYAQIPPLSASITPTTVKIKIGESITFTSTISGGQSPYNYKWYLNESAVSDATYPDWIFIPTSTGFYIVYLSVTDSLGNTVESNEASVTVMPKLAVSISPLSAMLLVGQSIKFTSTVSGGYSPYIYQWYLNWNPVSDANSPSWLFKPTSEGIHYVYLEVTDANNNTVQSKTARITAGVAPIGGYSVSLTRSVAKTSLICYTTLLTLFGAIMSLARHKRK